MNVKISRPRVDSQKPRRAAEPAVLEVPQQPVNLLAAGVERSAHGVAYAHHPGCVTAGERHLPLHVIHIPHHRRLAAAGAAG
jgi:hypothetical protein